MTGRYRVEHLTIDAAAAHAAAWADLAERALEPNVFNVPAFALPAARFIPGLRPRALLVWQGTRLVGLCLTAAGPPGWPLRVWLHAQAVAAFPLLDTVEAEQALNTMLRWAASRLHPGMLLSGLPQEGATARLVRSSRLAMKVVEARSRAVLPAGQIADGLAGGAGKEVRRQSRRLAEQGNVTVRSASTPAAVDVALGDFLRLEAAGWKGRRGTALAQSRGLGRFAATMAAAMTIEGGCHIHSLELDGQPIAIGLVLRSGPTAFYWKTAFDERYRRFSPGVHLTEAISRLQAAEAGLAMTDSCAVPDHAMIDRLWPARITVEDMLVGRAGQDGMLAALGAAERLRRTMRAQFKAALIALRTH